MRYVYANGNTLVSPYGISPGKHLYNEFGANVRLEVGRTIMTNIAIYSRLQIKEVLDVGLSTF